MKTILSLGLLLGMAMPAVADLTLSGPGITTEVLATKVPYKISFTLTSIYKFTFTGIMAKGNTLGAPGCSGTNGDGGQFHLSATIEGAGYKSREGKLTFRDVQDLNTAPTLTSLLDPPDVIKATTEPITITMEWKGEGNAHKPDGSFVILGEFQKEPPPPVGNLSFAVGDYLLIDAGEQPTGVAVVTRE
ncbi:MAG: hypothetical protein U0984_09280 [Prosthecobacter sp.]|nr:hypothetical protein [Prosthecobacter sp.]